MSKSNTSTRWPDSPYPHKAAEPCGVFEPTQTAGVQPNPCATCGWSMEDDNAAKHHRAAVEEGRRLEREEAAIEGTPQDQNVETRGDEGQPQACPPTGSTAASNEAGR